MPVRALMFERLSCAMAMSAFVALAGPIGRLLGLAPWQIGLAVTVAGAAWTLLARPWGSASDRFGRRAVLLVGLAGFALSFALLAGFVALALLSSLGALAAFVGLVLTRGLAGAFYAGVPPTTVALIANHAEPADRAGKIALLGSASGVGMVLGPALAGLLAGISLGLPLCLIAVLPVFAFIALWRGLPVDSISPGTALRPKPRLGDRRLRRPVLTAFIAMFSVTIAQVTIGFYAIDALALEPAGGARVAGIALAAVGVALTLSQLLVKKLPWTPGATMRIGTAIAALGFGATAFVSNAPALWLCYFIAASGMGWVWPSVSALAANRVAADEQGTVAGTVSAAQGLGAVVGPMAGTLIYDLSIAAPYLLVAAALAVTAVWPSRLN